MPYTSRAFLPLIGSFERWMDACAGARARKTRRNQLAVLKQRGSCGYDVIAQYTRKSTGEAVEDISANCVATARSSGPPAQARVEVQPNTLGSLIQQCADKCSGGGLPTGQCW